MDGGKPLRSTGFLVHCATDHGDLRSDLFHRLDRQHLYLCGDCAQQVHAYRHQLLSLQSGGVGSAAVSVWIAARDVLYMVEFPVRLRRGILHHPELRRGDLGQRHRSHYHGFHGGEVNIGMREYQRIYIEEFIVATISPRCRETRFILYENFYYKFAKLFLVFCNEI